MKTFFTVALALTLSEIPGGYAWGQFGRFVPIPRPAPVRLPIHSPIHPPFHSPSSSPQGTDPSQQDAPSGNSAAAHEEVAVISWVCLGFGVLVFLGIALAAVTGFINPDGSIRIGRFGFLVAPLVALRKFSRSTGLIRIIEVPPGEAPRSIREAWVGLELPLAMTEGQGRRMEIMGVLSQSPGVTTGYAVDGRVAIDRLGSQSPEAARWWRENACHVLVPGYQLVFPFESCRRLG
jgi:hypothetical protein